MNTPLTAADLVIGQKYVPLRKTVKYYGELKHSVEWKIAKEDKRNYLYYLGIYGGYHSFSSKYGIPPINGDFFNSSDVIPYEFLSGSYYQPLFDLLHREYNLMLLGSELDEIISVVKEMLTQSNSGEPEKNEKVLNIAKGVIAEKGALYGLDKSKNKLIGFIDGFHEGYVFRQPHIEALEELAREQFLTNKIEKK